MAIRDPERFLDRRTLRRHIKRGHVSEAEYTNFIAALPDVTENITPREEGGDDDGFETRMEAKAKTRAEEVEAAEATADGEAPPSDAPLSDAPLSDAPPSDVPADVPVDKAPFPA